MFPKLDLRGVMYSNPPFTFPNVCIGVPLFGLNFDTAGDARYCAAATAGEFRNCGFGDAIYCGFDKFLNCGNGELMYCAAGEFLNCGAGEFINCCPGEFLNCLAGEFINFGAGEFLNCGTGELI